MSLQEVVSTARWVISSEFGKFCRAFDTAKGINDITKVTLSILEGMSFTWPLKVKYSLAKNKVKICKDLFNFVNFFQLFGSLYERGGISHTPESVSKACLCFAKAMSSVTTWQNWLSDPNPSSPDVKTNNTNGTTSSSKGTSVKLWNLMRQDHIWKPIEGIALIAGFSIPIIFKTYNGQHVDGKQLALTMGKIIVIAAAKLIGHWKIEIEDKKSGEKSGIEWMKFDQQKHSSNLAKNLKKAFIVFDLGVNFYGYYLNTRK